MIVYCHKCNRHFFAGMERCPHCASEVKVVTWIKTASVIAFILAVLIVFVVVQKMDASRFGNSPRTSPSPTPRRFGDEFSIRFE